MIASIFSSPFLRLACMCLLAIMLLMGCIWLVPLPGAQTQNTRAILTQSDLHGDKLYRARTLEHTIKAPIFHENRLPPKPAPKVQAKKVAIETQRPTEMPFVLSGIIQTRDGSYKAYLQNRLTSQTLSVKSGDSAGEWLVEEVSSETVKLSVRQEKKTLQLNGGR